MHPLEQIFRSARDGVLPLTVIGGWEFSQYIADEHDRCLSVYPDIPEAPVYVFAMDEIESPTHLRCILRRINQKAAQ